MSGGTDVGQAIRQAMGTGTTPAPGYANSGAARYGATFTPYTPTPYTAPQFQPNYSMTAPSNQVMQSAGLLGRPASGLLNGGSSSSSGGGSGPTGSFGGGDWSGDSGVHPMLAGAVAGAGALASGVGAPTAIGAARAAYDWASMMNKDSPSAVAAKNQAATSDSFNSGALTNPTLANVNNSGTGAPYRPGMTYTNGPAGWGYYSTSSGSTVSTPSTYGTSEGE